MATSVAAKNETEQLVVDFIHAAYGERMDVDAMTALVSDDFVWQLHVPLSPVVVGRDAARAELEKHSQLSTGMIEGSEIRTIVSNDDTVIVERVDINEMNGVAVTFNVVAIFEVRRRQDQPLARILGCCPRCSPARHRPCDHVRSAKCLKSRKMLDNKEFQQPL